MELWKAQSKQNQQKSKFLQTVKFLAQGVHADGVENKSKQTKKQQNPHKLPVLKQAKLPRS